jgi:alginate O-acetyltransferase complex protein AlgI
MAVPKKTAQLILIMSTMADYVLGRLIDRRVRYKRLWLSFSLLLNLGLLAYFKYANFFVAELNSFLLGWKLFPIEWNEVILPIGISFFTFQKLSYIIDVYRGKSRALANVIDFALYIAMFPQQLYKKPTERATRIMEPFLQWNFTLLLGPGKKSNNR